MTNARLAAAERVPAHCFVGALEPAITVDGPDGHHLQRVRRLRVGERLTAADGSGRWRRYAIVTSVPGRLVIEAETEIFLDPEPWPAVVVAVALTKGAKLEAIVAQLTELGVSRIEPVRARRSVVRWDTARAEVAGARLRAVAREAAMQCRRARIPLVATVCDLAALAGRHGIVVAERGGGGADALPLPLGGTWTLVVGPEGGFEPGESEALDPIGSLALSPYVLRAQTAPVVAAALLVARGTSGSHVAPDVPSVERGSPRDA